jgi:hypothetical protein
MEAFVMLYEPGYCQGFRAKRTTALVGAECLMEKAARLVTNALQQARADDFWLLGLSTTLLPVQIVSVSTVPCFAGNPSRPCKQIA